MGSLASQPLPSALLLMHNHFPLRLRNISIMRRVGADARD